MKKGELVWEEDYGGLVCTCTRRVVGHTTKHYAYTQTVAAVPNWEGSPTEGGSYWVACSRCGAGAWSGI